MGRGQGLFSIRDRPSENGRPARLMVAIGLTAALVAAGADDPKGRGSSDFKPLWNGRDLEGWYLFLQDSPAGEDPHRVVTIEDGAIHAYAHDPNGAQVAMGYMGTKEELADYHLRLEYQWGKKQFKPRYLYKPDAGIYFHHVERDVVWPQAMQCQVELNGVGDLLTVGAIRVETTIDPKSKSDEWQEYLPAAEGGQPYTTKGEGVTYTRKRANHERDGWNRVDLICRGGEAAVLVNGHLVNRCSNMERRDPSDPDGWLPLARGRVLLEFEATEMFYRDIEVRTLGEGETLDAAIAGVEP